MRRWIKALDQRHHLPYSCQAWCNMAAVGGHPCSTHALIPSLPMHLPWIVKYHWGSGCQTCASCPSPFLAGAWPRAPEASRRPRESRAPAGPAPCSRRRHRGLSAAPRTSALCIATLLAAHFSPANFPPPSRAVRVGLQASKPKHVTTPAQECSEGGEGALTTVRNRNLREARSVKAG